MTRIRFTLFFIFTVSYSLLFAQPNLYFVNRAKHKIIEVKTGQQLSLKYKGYMGQPEFVKQTVTEINDSMITLGIDPAAFGFLQNKMENTPKYIYRNIMLRDILKFRRMTNGRVFLKTGFMLASIVGSYFLLTDLYQNSSFTTGQTFLISIGTGLASTILINALLPENPKYKTEDGWEIVTGNTMPPF